MSLVGYVGALDNLDERVDAQRSLLPRGVAHAMAAALRPRLHLPPTGKIDRIKIRCRLNFLFEALRPQIDRKGPKGFSRPVQRPRQPHAGIPEPHSRVEKAAAPQVLFSRAAVPAEGGSSAYLER
jgi:hypothetical protein